MKKKKNYYLSASIICSDFKNLQKDVKLLEKGGIDYIHFDVMDGVFVPRYGLFPEVLRTIKNLTNIPVDVHMMIENPEPYIDIFAESGADIISVQVENNNHLHRTIMKIKNAGVDAGVVLNPATSLESLKYIQDDINLVMIMAINPGIVGHGLIKQMLDKITEVKNYVDKDIFVQVDGGVNFKTAPVMLDKGANMLVCGVSTIFQKEKPINVKIKELHNILDKHIN